MNNESLVVALRELHMARTQLPDPPELHQRVLALPFDRVPQQRGFLPPFTGVFQSMFSATRFVVAGVIVALFGGFLLAGVLTQQGAESPPVGASASAARDVRSDVLLGVDLEVEVVGPRLVRVLGDGQRQTRTNIQDMAVAPNGDVWVKRQNGTVFRLGEPGNAFKDRYGDLYLGEDNTLWLSERRLEGRRWVKVKDRGAPCQWGRRGLDGICWTGSGPESSFGGRDESGVRIDGGLDGYPGFGQVPIEVAEDGTVWTAMGRDPFAGLAYYDGASWTAVEKGPPEATELFDFAVAPDGVVWLMFVGHTGVVGHSGDPALSVMSWDGDTWTTRGPWVDAPFDGMDFLPNGSIWFGRVAEFHGDELRPIEVLAPIGDKSPMVVANAPDGSTWMVVGEPDKERGGLYVITPEAGSRTFPTPTPRRTP